MGERREDVLMELSFMEIILIILRKKWLIIGCSVGCAFIAFLVSFFLLTPQYQATTSLFVNNNANRTEDSVTSIGDITASQELVGTYIQILYSNAALDAVIEKQNLGYTASEVRNMVAMAAKNNTEVLEISVISDDPDEAIAIANTLLAVAPDILTRVVRSASVEVIDTATGVQKVGPNVELNTVICLLLGLFLSVFIAFIVEVLDKRIKREDELALRYQYPLLAVIPDSFDLQKKGGYYHEKK